MSYLHINDVTHTLFSVSPAQGDEFILPHHRFFLPLLMTMLMPLCLNPEEIGSNYTMSMSASMPSEQFCCSSQDIYDKYAGDKNIIKVPFSAKTQI